MPRPERPLGPGADVLVEFASDLRRLRELSGSPTYRELAGETGYSVTTLSEAAGGRKLPSLAAVTAYVRGCGGDVVEWEERWRKVAAEMVARQNATPNDPTDGAAEQSPYVGLAAFQCSDADRFFGRERLVGELLDRVAERRFVSVFGASGAGKSSLLRAGFAGNARTGWPVAVFTPGAHPLEEYAARLADMPSDAEFVLVVDQFEEIFTLCQDAQEREAFVTALVSATQAAGSRVRVVLGVRADFYAYCLDYPDLTAVLHDSQVLVGPMTTEELRQATIQPAARTGCMVEGALVAAIVAEAAGRTGVLPLVSHALVETWRRRRGNTLTLSGYEAAGGIQGALAQTAESLFTTFTPRQQRMTKDLLLRLTVLGEGIEDTKRRIGRAELHLDDPDVETVLDILTEARLITVDTNTIELTHEALIGAWPRLRRWLTDDREGLRTLRQLTEAAHSWVALGRDPGALYRGARLEVAREWAASTGHLDELNPTERAFLDTSTIAERNEHQAAVRRNRLLRSLAVGLTILLLVAITVGVVAVRQRQDAVDARQSAVTASQVAVSRQIAAEALALLDSRPGTAMLLSMEAFQIASTVEARSTLLSMSAHQAYQTEFAGHTDAIAEVAFSPDGRTMATASKDKTVIIWDIQSRTRVTTLKGHPTWLRTVQFSQDGRVLATGGDDKKVMLWDAVTGAPLATLAGHADIVKAVAFSPDGRTLASASADKTVIVWDLTSRTRVTTLTGHTGFVQALAYSPDSRMIATASADLSIGLWDLATGNRLAALPGHTGSVDDVTFSPDGRTLASASVDQTVMLWDLASRTRLATLIGHTAEARTVDFSIDGQTLASAGHDQTVIVWDVGRRTPVARLSGQPGNVYSLAFHPSAPMLASAGEDGTIQVWNPTLLPLTGHTGWINDIEFTRDGRVVATASADGSVILWDAERRSRLKTLPDTGVVNGLAVSPDGRTLATANGSAQHPPRAADYTVTLWDITTGESLGKLAGHTNRVHNVTFSPDGRIVASASTDKTVVLWDVAQRTRLATLGQPQDANSAVFSPDGKILAISGHGPTIALWDVARRTQLGTLTGHTGAVRTMSFSPDGRTLASGSADETVILWDLESRSRLGVLAGNAGAMITLAFSSDGRTLASASSDRSVVVLWDTLQRTRIATLTGHSGQVRGVAFSPDGRTLATGGTDKTVILWDVDPRQTAARICGTLARDLTQDEWAQFVPDIPYRETCPRR